MTDVTRNAVADVAIPGVLRNGARCTWVFDPKPMGEAPQSAYRMIGTTTTSASKNHGSHGNRRIEDPTPCSIYRLVGDDVKARYRIRVSSTGVWSACSAVRKSRLRKRRSSSGLRSGSPTTLVIALPRTI